MVEFEDTRKKWHLVVAKCLLLPQRGVVAIMCMLAIVNAYTMRLCLSVAITKIVVPRTYGNNSNAVCPPDPADVVAGPESSEGRFDWSQVLQGYILSFFYIGYVLTHIPGGEAAQRYGAKWVLALGILSTALLTFLTPLCIYQGGPIALIVLRVCIGLGEGPTFPAISAMLVQWIPPRERGFLGALVMGGAQIGTICGTLFSGLILSRMHWIWVFYFFGFAGCLWVAFFIFLCASDPVTDKFVSPEEKTYLMEENGRVEREHHLPPTPWFDILTSVPMIVLVFCQLGHDWGLFMMASDLPKYMNDVMRFNVKKNAVYSSLPYVLMWIVSISMGLLSDYLINHNKVGRTKMRKANTGIAAIGPAVFMVAASYSGCNRAAVVIFFILAMGSMGPYYSGMKLTALDLSTNYSGTLMALTNGLAAICGTIAPPIVGWMTPDTTMLQWRNVYWLTFIILTVTVIPYCIWATADTQPWNEGSTRKKKKAEVEEK